MCLAALFFRVVEDAAVVVGANREVFYARPGTTPQVVDGPVRFVAGVFPAGAPADLVVIPLAFRGDRTALYRRPPAPLLVVHDWLWRARGRQYQSYEWRFCLDSRGGQWPGRVYGYYQGHGRRIASAKRLRDHQHHSQ